MNFIKEIRALKKKIIYSKSIHLRRGYTHQTSICFYNNLSIVFNFIFLNYLFIFNPIL